MEFSRILVLRKAEWNQLKNKANPPKPQEDQERKDYIKEIAELSKNWMKSWPDTNENIVQKAIDRKERRQKHLQREWKEHELAWLQEVRENSKIALKNAKQRIFETTCYGQQLMSALRESKAMEERELQIKFKIEQKNIAKGLDNELNRKCNFRFGVKTNDIEEKRRLKNIEIAELNYCMDKTMQEIEQKEAQEERILEQEDARLQKECMADEAKAMRKCGLIFKNAAKISLEDDKRFREDKKKAEEADVAIIAIWRKHQENCRKKEKDTMKKIYTERYNMPAFKQNYEEIAKAKAEFEKRYDFITKAANEYEKTQLENYRKDSETEKQSRQKDIEIAQINKREGEITKLIYLPRKCVCERSSLFTESCYKPPKTTDKDYTTHNDITFHNSSKNIQEQLRKREKKPTPWSGLEGTHDYFAKQASETLKECRNKRMARKVVDNYRQTNLLNAEKLPVENN